MVGISSTVTCFPISLTYLSRIQIFFSVGFSSALAVTVCPLNSDGKPTLHTKIPPRFSLFIS